MPSNALNALLASQFFSCLGSSTAAYAQRLWILNNTDSVAAFALTAFFAECPGLLVAPFAGTLADTYPRRMLIVGADAFASATNVLLFAMASLGSLSPIHIYVANIVFSIGKAFQQPAVDAMFYSNLPASTRVGAMAGLFDLVIGTNEMLAPGFAAFLLGTMGYWAVVVTDVMTCACASGILFYFDLDKTSKVFRRQLPGKAADEDSPADSSSSGTGGSSSTDGEDSSISGFIGALGAAAKPKTAAVAQDNDDDAHGGDGKGNRSSTPSQMTQGLSLSGDGVSIPIEDQELLRQIYWEEDNDEIFVRRMFTGLRWLRRDPAMMSILILFAWCNFCHAFVTGLLPVVLYRAAGSLSLGTVQSVASMGVLIGGVGVAWLNWIPKRNQCTWCFRFILIQGCIISLNYFKPIPWAVAIFGFVYYTMDPVITSTASILWKVTTPDSLQGRMSSLRFIVVSIPVPIANLMTGPSVDYFTDLVARTHESCAAGTTSALVCALTPYDGIAVVLVLAGVSIIAAVVALPFFVKSLANVDLVVARAFKEDVSVIEGENGNAGESRSLNA